MKTEYEQIKTDAGSSMRLLSQRVRAEQFGWSYHYHPEFEMVFVLNGTGRRHVGNHLSYYEDGDLVLIGSNLPHAGFGYDAIGLHEEIVVQFREDFLGEKFFQSAEMSNILALLERSKQGLSFKGNTKNNIGKKLIDLVKLPNFERLLAMLQIFHDLSLSTEFELLNPVNTQYDFSHKDEVRLKKIYQYVEQNYRKTIEVSEAAAIASLTIPSFCNYFKKIMHLTFTEFVNEFRINQACKLLYEEKSIVDVCYSVGFNNVSYFSKVFREIKGKTPSQFRKMVLRKAVKKA